MKFIIHGRKLEVTEPIRNYIESKIGRLDKYFENPDDITATVVVRIRGIDQVVEVTIPIHKITLRGEENHSDLYAAIDTVSDKLERQIRKNKTRMSRRHARGEHTGMDLSFDDYRDDEEALVVKRKEIETKPMSEEEAILQMNMLGHDFFVFKNDATSEIGVLYKRKDGQYGIIEAK